MRNARGDEALTPAKIEKFLESFAQTANAGISAKIAGTRREYIYRTKKIDPKFAQRYEEARKLGVEAMEDELVERAKKSDTLLIFFLKGNKPEKYRDNVNLSGQVDLLPGVTIERLINIAKRGGKSGGDTGGKE